MLCAGEGGQRNAKAIDNSLQMFRCMFGNVQNGSGKITYACTGEAWGVNVAYARQRLIPDHHTWRIDNAFRSYAVVDVRQH